MKDKFLNFLLFVLIITVIISIIYIINMPVKAPSSDICEYTTDEVKFKDEYSTEIKNNSGKTLPAVNIPDDNNIVYLNDGNLIDTLKSEKGIVYFGFNRCPWCRRMLPYMFQAMENQNINKIYYYDFYDIRESYISDKNSEGGKLYAELISIIGDKLTENIDGTDTKRLGAPNVFAFNRGKILGNHEGVLEDYDDYEKELTKEQEKELVNAFEKLFALTHDICGKDDTTC